MLRVIRQNQFPKGGWVYIQPQTGMSFGGNERFKPQCLRILTHRMANHLPRASLEEVSQDLVDYTCKRFPSMCVDDGKVVVRFASTNTVAVSDKTESEPRKRRKCRSCGGRKA